MTSLSHGAIVPHRWLWWEHASLYPQKSACHVQRRKSSSDSGLTPTCSLGIKQLPEDNITRGRPQNLPLVRLVPLGSSWSLPLYHWSNPKFFLVLSKVHPEFWARHFFVVIPEFRRLKPRLWDYKFTIILTLESLVRFTSYLLVILCLYEHTK